MDESDELDPVVELDEVLLEDEVDEPEAEDDELELLDVGDDEADDDPDPDDPEIVANGFRATAEDPDDEREELL